MLRLASPVAAEDVHTDAELWAAVRKLPVRQAQAVALHYIEDLPIKEIAENSHVFRTLGLGYANLGALIMSYGLGYDSDEGRSIATRQRRSLLGGGGTIGDVHDGGASIGLVGFRGRR